MVRYKVACTWGRCLYIASACTSEGLYSVGQFLHTRTHLLVLRRNAGVLMTLPQTPFASLPLLASPQVLSALRALLSTVQG